ncbi:MAG TPA: energy transducer TonB [Candidatus Acidoferrum sp.]|nr:energy transducer TonB [Candidatus Acidoferrum sp.]
MKILILKIAILGLFCFGLSAPANEPGLASGSTLSETQASVAISESTAGLQAQLAAILEAAKDRKSNRFDDLISDLQVPDDANWFAAEFGDESGSKLAATYKSSWESYQDSLTNAFRNSGNAKHASVVVKEFSSASPPAENDLIRAVLLDAKNPLVLYTAESINKRRTDSLPGLYIYARGAFRVVNWTTFYGLPNVRPMRIRIGGNVAVAQLVHQVSPVYPPEAQHSRIQGMVVLHVVIGIDGQVIKVEPIGGPSELVPAAMDAVRQWRYKPTLLNGDPVEVDTTVSIDFALGG